MRVTREDGRVITAGLASDGNQLPSGARRSHDLIDARGRDMRAWIQERDAHGGDVLWQANFGGQLIKPTHLLVLKDGGIVLGGEAGSRLHALSYPGASSLSPNGPVLLKLSPDGANVRWLRSGGNEHHRLNSLNQDRQGHLVWTTVTKQGGGAPTLHRLTADGQSLDASR